MGGYMKVHTQTQSKISMRGRSYGLMFLLALVGAMLGVMVLHKLREARIFNLLVKQKDHQLISLQLLLQKEREYAKETKGKTEEMKATIDTLRTQKMELDNRILEMQATISSLKDEQRAMESAIEEKHNEIKFLREREIDLNKENPQLTTLTETLKKKEAEFEELKHRHDLPYKIWSVSADDPSNRIVNLTTKEEQKDHETKVTENEENSVGLNKTRNYERRENSMRDAGGSGNASVYNRDDNNLTHGEGGRENGVGIVNRREIPEEGGFGHGSAASENSRDDGKGQKLEGSQDGEILITRDEENKANPNSVDGGVKHASFQEGGNQEVGVNKLELQQNSRNRASYKLGGNHGNLRKGKGKRWRIISKSKVSVKKGDENSFASIRGRKFFNDAIAIESGRNERTKNGELQKLGSSIRNESNKEDNKLNLSDELQQIEGLKLKNDDRAGFENGEEKAAPDGEWMKNGENDEEIPLERKNSVIYRHSQGSENTKDKIQNINIDQQVEREHEMDSEGDDEVEKSEEQTEGIGVVKRNNESKQANVADKYKEPEDLEVEDIQKADKDIFTESSTEIEEDKEEYNDET